MSSRAEKKLKSAYGTLNRKFGLGNKYRSALKSFEEAQKLFSTLANPEKEGESLEGMALCYENLSMPSEACHAYQNAGRTYVRSIDHSIGKFLGPKSNYETRYQRAFHCFEKASGIFGEIGRALQAGKCEKEVVMLISEEVAMLKKAIEQEEDYIDSVKKLKRKKKMKPKKETMEDFGSEEEEEEESGEEGDGLFPREELVNIEEDRVNEDEELEKKVEIDEKTDLQNRRDNIQKFKEKIKSRVKNVTKHGKRGSRFFEGSRNNSNCNQILEMSGDVCAMCYDGEKAADFYEMILDADWNAENEATGRRSKIQFVANKIITKLLLAQLLATDMENVMEKLSDIKSDIKRFVRNSRGFKDSDTHVLIHGICIAFQNQDEKRFQKAVRRYSKTNKIKDFMLEMLLMLKKHLVEEIIEGEESML